MYLTYIFTSARNQQYLQSREPERYPVQKDIWTSMEDCSLQGLA